MKTIILLVVAILSASCFSAKNSEEDVIQYKNIEKHIVTLASDRFMGRMPAREAEKITVDYIASQMKEIGLEPANTMLNIHFFP